MKEKNLTIEYIKINNLIPYKNNPRINDKAAEIVAESIKNFGFKNPIIIDKNNVIIAGHTRLKAAIKLELEEVPTIKIEDLTEEQIKAFRIADNKTNEYAEWDMNLLTNELKEIGDVFSGFDFKELQKLLPEKSAEEDDYEIEVPDEPKSRLGEVYQLGNHRLMCGDSTKLKDVGRLIDQKIDLVVTDPPYNVNYGSKADAINKYGYNFSDRKIANDYMPSLEFLRFLDETFFNMKEHMKDGAAFYIWHASTTVYEFEEALKKNNLKTRQQLIWVKNAFVLSRQDYHWQHEPCLYGWKEGAAHYFVNDRTQSTVFEDKINIEKMKKSEMKKMLEDIMSNHLQTTVIKHDRPNISTEHPTMKPVKLIGTLIKNSSKPNENVLDLFGGSGSTLIACEQLNRKCYMMEYDPKYVDVIIDRWEKYTGQKAVKIEKR